MGDPRQRPIAAPIHGTRVRARGKWDRRGPDRAPLYVGSWHDIQVVGTATVGCALLPSAAPSVTASFDGLYWYDGGLVGIQNSLHPGRVVRLPLDPERGDASPAPRYSNAIIRSLRG